MNKKLISLAIAGAVSAPFAAQAGSLNVANQDITLSGGITGGYVYTSQGPKQDAFIVPDALFDFSSDANNGVGFTAGVGRLMEHNIGPGSAASETGTGTNPTFGLQYGWVTLKPVDNLTVDAGKLATNVGYEVSPSYENANMLLGLVWGAQPTYYTGARATYSMNGMSVYGEVSKFGTPGAAIGASGDFGGMHGAINYYTRVDSKSIIDIIASGKVGGITVGANLDYTLLADSAKKVRVAANGNTSVDDNALGLALYASIMPMDKVTLPVRIEYVDGGTSGIYVNTFNSTTGRYVSNSAISFTVTPTYNFTDSTFVRAELAYVTTDKKGGGYVDDKGAADDTGWVIGGQAGVRF